MRTKRILSFILCFVMLISVFPQIAFASDGKDERTVYLYAQSENDTAGTPAISNPPNRSIVYMGETANVYFAVDNPNKGLYENGEHKEPQYDLNGYTVKIYFDPAYFDYAADNTQMPIDYKIPNTALGDSGSDKEDTGSGEVDDVPQEAGYYVYRQGSGTYDGYKTAFITVFTSGTHFPQSTDLSKWYNLSNLPLTPLKTGSTEIFIDVDGLEYGTANDFQLELFAKNTSDKLEEQTFNYNAINGGRHTVVIRDRLKPTPPTATPGAGRYITTQKVTLTSEEENCEIWYKTSGEDDYHLYAEGEEIEISISDTISCYVVRIGDGKKSNIVNYEYNIVPKAPHLFDNDKNLIPNNYSENSSYTVYVSDEEIWGAIADGSEVYYTFASLDDAENLDDGTDPETEWVKIDKRTQSIEITKNRTVRLITSKLGELSDISEYNLGILPASVTAEPEHYPPTVYNSKIDVTLSTVTVGATIYYTLDGTDPIQNGLEYIDKITLTNDTVIRAVAYYDGIHGEVSTFNYIFDYYADDGITAFYPSGVYEGSVDVTLIPNNPENEIEYSIDGGNTWVKGDTLNIDKDTDIIAVTIDKDGNRGSEYKFTYKIKPLPPAFAPESTQFTNADKITVYCVESTDATKDRYELYYTLDGTDPITSVTRIKANDTSDTAVIDINGYTQVRAVIYKDNERYSTVVTHSYDVVTLRPVKPITTLTPGTYTREIGSTEGFFTQFMPVPEGTEIYYTIGNADTFFADPIPNTDGTIKYISGDEIELKGNQIIKAVAVNVFGVKSDVGIFEYTIIPEAPKAAPSATIYSENLPVVPVSAVAGSTISYEINGKENSFVTTDGEFYIDTATGNAYKDKECTEQLGSLDNTEKLTSPAILNIYATLDGVNSYTNTYTYAITDDNTQLAPPYADKETGTYEEINADGNNNYLLVNLYSMNNVGEIEYRKNNGAWTKYEGGTIAINEDTVLQARTVNGTDTSAVASYVYSFVPLAPIIVLPSGRYAISDGEEISTTIIYDSRIPTNKVPGIDYNIFYRSNGDFTDIRYMDADCVIDHTMSFKAYVLNEKTGKVSKNTINYYIIEKAQTTSGTVYVANPYDANRISSHLLSSGAYASGIKLVSQNKNADIHYYYSYTKIDGTQATTNNLVYDAAAPIMVNATFDEITIYAWLEDADGKIVGSDYTHKIDFIGLGVPVTSLGTSKTEYAKGTEFTIINDYPDDENITLYYTLDETDPADKGNTERNIYNGETLAVNGETIVKAVYYSSCGTCVSCKNGNKDNCWYGVFGEVGNYRYTNPTVISTGGSSGGGGGGGSTIDKTRKYTEDMFGTEHPTHIGYINGYPDGSVQPDGNITREEVTSILYRVRYKEYNEPFVATGTVFPDVAASRWSVNDIEFMADKEVVYGYPDGEFKPSRNLSRAEFAALIRRFTGLTKPSAENVFPDLDDTHWAYEDIMIVLEAGLMQGYEDGTFRAERSITRAEVMKVVNIILGRCPDESYVKGLDFNPFNDLNKDAWHYVTVLEATITHDYYLNSKETLEIKWENWK